MASSIKTISFLFVISCSLMIVVECNQELKVDERVKKRQTESLLSSYHDHLYENQQQYQNQNQPQSNKHIAQSYGGYSLPPTPSTHSRGALILPANNQIQLNNFHSQQPYLSSLGPYQTGMSINNNNHIIVSKSTTETPILNVIKTNHSTNKQQQSFGSTTLKGSEQKSDLEGSIELALRQTNGDENVFQPFPTIDTHQEHHTHFDWNSSSETQPKQNLKAEKDIPNDGRAQPDIMNEYQLNTSTITTPINIATTELSNNNNNNNIVLIQNELPTKENQPDNHHYDKKEVFDTQAAHYPVDNSLAKGLLYINVSNQSSSVDINNQLTYEGPATAPSVGDGYYFSSSERIPNIDMKSSNAWWAIGFGQEFDMASNLTTYNYIEYCTKSDLLINNKQRSLCKLHHKIMPIVARAMRLAIDECQFRFSKNRWNCSLAIQQELLSNQQTLLLTNNNHKNNNVQVFGELMKQPIRERSFLNAIIAAALAHTMTKACSQGELPEECSCDKRIRSRNNNNQKNKVEWVACSDDIDYGTKFSRDFTDNTDYDSDTTSMINIHNYEVGRRVLKSLTDITCTCQNGENGLCQTKKCWKHLGQFADIGDELMKRYEGATHVQLSNKDPHKLRPVRRGVRKPKRKDLVYIDESPDYCNQDTRLGILGTQNRHCNSTSLEQDSCSLLCCGRGYQVVVEEIEEDCNCKFVWCCQVRCDKCKKQVTYDICN